MSKFSLDNVDNLKFSIKDKIRKNIKALNEGYGDSDFEREAYNWIMNDETYYNQMTELLRDKNYDGVENLIKQVADEKHIEIEGEDDVYDTVQYFWHHGV